MIDIHGHFLPGLDDGARDLDQSLVLLSQAVDEGVTHVVMTPHYWPEVYEYKAEPTWVAFERVQEAIAKRGWSLSTSLAAEVRFCADTLSDIEQGTVPMLGSWLGRQAVLLELPDGAIPPGTAAYCERLIRKNVQPIIAHPERIRSVMKDVNLLEPFVRSGCLLQLTCASVLGRFGPGAHQAAWAILRAGWAHFIASDAHHPEHRPPLNGQAASVIANEIGLEYALTLTLTNAAQLLDSESSNNNDVQLHPAEKHQANAR